MKKQKKTNRGRTNQTNLANFATQTAKAKVPANNEAMEEGACGGPAVSVSPMDSPEKQPEEDITTAREESGDSLTTILVAISTMKTEMSSKFKGVIAAIEGETVQTAQKELHKQRLESQQQKST